MKGTHTWRQQELMVMNWEAAREMAIREENERWRVCNVYTVKESWHTTTRRKKREHLVVVWKNKGN